MCLFSVGRCKSSRCKALVNSYTARRKMGWEIWLTFLIGVTLFLLFICLFPTSTSLTFTCRTLQHSSLDWSQLIRRRCNICSEVLLFCSVKLWLRRMCHCALPLLLEYLSYLPFTIARIFLYLLSSTRHFLREWLIHTRPSDWLID